MKDLIIGGYMGENPNPVNIWIESIKQSGFSGDIVLILIGCNVNFKNQIKSKGVTIVEKPLLADKTTIYSQRFYHIYNYLKMKNKYKYVITTDVTDIIFQTNPSKFVKDNIEDKKIISNAESILFKNEDWNINNYISAFGTKDLDDLLEKEVQNVGVIAGEQKYVRELLLDIHNMCKSAFAHPSDQSAYNYLINLKKYHSITNFLNIDSGWVCNCSVIFCPERAQEFEGKIMSEKPFIFNNFVINSNKKPVCIVHQYNRNLDLLKIVYKKYLDISLEL